MRGMYLGFAVFGLACVGAIALFLIPHKAESPGKAGLPDLITVTTPLLGATVSSPLVIAGEARGPWYFEASFPVELQDASGTVIANAPAQAQGEWMTQEFVPFAVSLSFPIQPAGSQGTLVLHKDNPSGDPERDQEVAIPVRF